MPFYGTDTDMAICYQNSYGTIADIANSAQVLPVVSQNISSKRPHIIQENMRGIYEEGESYQGLHEVSGEVEMEAHPISIGYLFGAFFGSASVTTSDAIYTHAWTPLTAAFDGSGGSSFKRPVTFAMNGSYPGTQVNFLNLVANTLEIGVSNGELLKVKAGFIGGRDDDGSGGYSISYPAGSERFTWDVASIEIIGSSAIDYCKELTITMEDPVEPKYYLDGGIWPGKNILSGMRKVSFSATFHYENNSLYNYFWDKDTNSIDITLEDKSTEIQSGYYNKLNIQLDRLRFETAEANRSGPGETLLTINGNAQYDSSISQLCSVTLTNTKSVY